MSKNGQIVPRVLYVYRIDVQRVVGKNTYWENYLCQL